nr:pentatricopeptide repeat-containing protein [Tanacetum cinerariifolium]
MYCAEDDRFEMTPPLNDDEVGTEDLILNVSDLENDILNDAAKILDGIMIADDIAISKKRKVVSRGNSISIRENDGHNVVLTDSESDCSDHAYKNSESDSDQFGEVDDTRVGLTLLIREHEKSMEALLRKLKGNKMGITYPFSILEDLKETYPIYDDLTHWKLKKTKLGEKFPTVDKFKECLTYYALANGFSLYFEKGRWKECAGMVLKKEVAGLVSPCHTQTYVIIMDNRLPVVWVK